MKARPRGTCLLWPRAALATLMHQVKRRFSNRFYELCGTTHCSVPHHTSREQNFLYAVYLLFF
jgi:hypothetical protein